MKNKLIKSLCLTLIFGLTGCIEAPPPPSPTPGVKKAVDGPQLTLNNAVLEQANAQGQTLWKIQAVRSIYSQNSKIAKLEQITGNLFQDGEVVLEVSAKSGDIEQNGEVIFLKGDIIATDKRNGAVFQAKELKWYPQEGLLKVNKNFRGSHPQLEISALEAKYYSRSQRLELIGNIIGTNTEEKIQLKTEHLYWELAQEKLKGNKPVEIVRYENNTVTDQVVANSLEIDFKKNLAELAGNIQFKSINPQVQVATNKASWNYQNRTINVPVPVEVKQQKEQLTMNANQAKVDLTKKVAYLEGGVKGTSLQKKAQIYSDQLVWSFEQEIINATGNVVYQQGEPKMQLKGVKAVGKLQDNSIVVSGNNNTKVLTEIIP